MNKHSKITSLTRESLIKSFCLLYEKKPIEKISIGELTTLAGYNRTTFYNYFEDIYDLLNYIETFAISHIKDGIITTLKKGDPKQRLIDSFIDIYEKWGFYIKILLNNSHSLEFTHNLKKEIFTTCMDTFNLQKDNIKAKYILEFYLSALISVINKWIQNEDNISKEEMGELLKDMLPISIFEKIDKYKNKIRLL